MKRILSIAVLLLLARPVYSQNSLKNMHVQERDYGTIVFMGNSIIQGWQHADPDLFSSSKLINRGIGGQTTSQMLSRFEADVIDENPRAVLILAGTNDIAGNNGEISLEGIRDNIAGMVQMALERDIEVILCSVLPAADYHWSRGRQPDIKIPQLNLLIRELAQEKSLYFLDYFSTMADDRNGLPKEFAEDGVHPTRRGYDVMKEMTLEAFKELNLLP
jgi:lysophospholipase L1-like esterase